MRQTPNESPLKFPTRVQTHLAKMHAVIIKQNLTANRRGTLERTGLRAFDPEDIITAVIRIRCELQLHYLETQKFSSNRNVISQVRKPLIPVKQCTFRRRGGPLFNECLSRQGQFQPPQTNYNQNFRTKPVLAKSSAKRISSNTPLTKRILTKLTITKWTIRKPTITKWS